MKSSKDRLIQLIAIFKLLKAGLLIGLGVGAFRVLHKDLAGAMEHVVETLRLDPGNRFIDAALAKVSSLNPGQVKKLGVGSFLYAGVFLTEGIGLWLLKPWAEWFTTIITGSLVPVEIYEIHRHPSWAKVGVLVVNLAIVAYLIFRIRHRRSKFR
jgi:uncharacterized membrane protein (DUF2068 family)